MKSKKKFTPKQIKLLVCAAFFVLALINDVIAFVYNRNLMVVIYVMLTLGIAAYAFIVYKSPDVDNDGNEIEKEKKVVGTVVEDDFSLEDEDK